MMRLVARVEDSAQLVRFTATRTGDAAPRLEALADGVPLAALPAGASGPVTQEVGFEALRDLTAGQLALRVDGAPATPGGMLPEGEFFEALQLPDAARFFAKVQLHHSRYASPLLLELGAKLAHERFAGDALTRAAALTILGHRHIERLAPERGPAEAARIAWLLERARPLVAGARKRLAPGAPRPGEPPTPRPAWQDVRWHVSLATVAGHLYMAQGNYAAARDMYALPRHSLHWVGLSKVSALNMVTGCFLHGVTSHILGDAEAARASLEAGIGGVKPAVQAQDLMANVWVVGDLINVLRVARQCFIARVRLGLLPEAGAEPLVDEGSVLTLDELPAPLPALARGGLLPRLRNHLLRHGGR